MQRAAQAATIGFSALMVFQAALAAGVPLGDAAWGGADAHLTTGQRIGSALAVVFYLAAIVIVRRRAAGRAARRYRWGTWTLAAVLATSAAMNAASDSAWETYMLAPLGLVLAGLCLVVARSARTLADPAADVNLDRASSAVDSRADPRRTSGRPLALVPGRRRRRRDFKTLGQS